MKSIIILIFFIKNLSCFAQETPNIITHGKHGLIYYQDGKKLKPKELRSILLSTPESAVYYKKYKTANIIAYSSLPMMLLFVMLAAKQNDGNYYPRTYKTKFLIFAGTSLLFGINAGYFQIKGFKLYKQSLKAYNKTRSLVVL
jgi:hypothetical protein